MDPKHRPLFFDDRLARNACIYCGGKSETSEHAPSKVLLDEPYPQTLPVVEACAGCNTSFSLDEQYLACFLECVIYGTVEPQDLHRAKVRRIFQENDRLQHEIRSARKEQGGTLVWYPKLRRVENVIAKLAQGHAAYELYPQPDSPRRIAFTPLLNLPRSEREEFEGSYRASLLGWPELGTRAFYRACGESPDDLPESDDWVVVQPGRYRYCVVDGAGVRVKMVLSEYLACIADWV